MGSERQSHRSPPRLWAETLGRMELSLNLPVEGDGGWKVGVGFLSKGEGLWVTSSLPGLS